LRFPFLELPGQPLVLRPAVVVGVEGLEDAPQLCLLDSGSLRNRFARWLADAAGIPLDGAPEERVAIGGTLTTATVARVELRLAEMRFDSPVWFCDPWPFAFHVLGQEGFLRHVHVELCAAEGWLELVSEPHA
jgi:hypothetical protein